MLFAAISVNAAMHSAANIRNSEHSAQVRRMLLPVVTGSRQPPRLREKEPGIPQSFNRARFPTGLDSGRGPVRGSGCSGPFRLDTIMRACQPATQLPLSNSNWLLLLPFAVLTGLSGCATAPEHPIPPAQAVARIEGRTLSDPGLAAFLAKQEGASTAQGMWDVERLTLAAFYYSPVLDQARAQWRMAEGAAKIAHQTPNPMLAASPGYNSTTASASPWIFNLAVDLFLDLTGRRRAQHQQADAQLEAARFQVAATAWQVRASVRTALLEVYAARETSARLEVLENIQRETVALSERMLSLGGVSAYEVTQARTALDATLNQAVLAHVRETDALSALARTIGIAPAVLQTVTLDLSGFRIVPDQLPAAEARRAALLNRADLLSALAGYDAASRGLRLAQASTLGDVRVTPGYQFDQGDDKWSLGLGGLLPVFNQNQGQIAQASGQLQAAKATVDTTQANAIAEMDAAIAAYLATRQRLSSSQSYLAELDRQLTIAKARVASGEASRFELALRSTEIANAQLARTGAIVAAQQALGRVENAMQQSTQSLPSLTSHPRAADDQ